MKDPYSGLYEVTEIHNLRDVIKKRLHEFPQNPVFLVKEKKGGEYIPISTEKYDHDIDSLCERILGICLFRKFRVRFDGNFFRFREI